MGMNPQLDKLILKNYNDLCDKIDNQLIEFHNKLDDMIKELEPENMELLMNIGIVDNLDKLKEQINK
jgi:hypothetical protein